jgi:hypothetical protein
MASTQDGRKTVLLNGLLHPVLHIHDQTHIYFAEGPGSVIKKLSITGNAVTVLAGGLMMVGGIAIDRENVYFTERERGTVSRVSKNGGPVITLTKGLYKPWVLTIDRGSIYVAEGYDPAEKRESLKSYQPVKLTFPRGLEELP